jgi:pilus assembly protein CpaC
MWPSHIVRHLVRHRRAAALALVFLSCAPAVGAQPPDLQLDVSRGRLLTLPQPASSVFVADPGIAGVQVPSERQIFVFGKKPGQTTLYALGEDGKEIEQVTITVRLPVSSAQSALDNASPGALHVVGSNNGLALRGTVATPDAGAIVTHAVSATMGQGETLQNDAKVLSSAQVTLRVRIAEVDRNVIKALGFNWNEATKIGKFALGPIIGRQTFSNASSTITTAGGATTVTNTPSLFIPDGEAGNPGSLILNGITGGIGIQAVIDALADEGMVTLLAEPTLTAMSGEPASFLAGGEFPIPVAQAGGTGAATITIDFKQFGVSLNFVPTVVAANRISLHVRPEVSQLVTSGGGAIEIGGFTVPGLTVRRADTTIELGSGESFAIAGLMQNNTNTDVSNFPGLADLPILGPLFRSTHFTRNESELVVIVTPYITQPVADPHALRLPIDGLAPANDIDRILSGRVFARSTMTPGGTTAASAVNAPHLAGDAGFDIE